jgi:uncharacterized protein (UPF0264 family)
MEAALAVAGKADLIDVKEPSAGSLGAASAQVWCEVAAAVAGARPLSAALGELIDFPLGDSSSRDLSPLVHYQYAKLGLAGCAHLPDWGERWQQAFATLPASIVRVAVAYADYRHAAAPPPLEVAARGHAIGCQALLFDTYCKADGNLFEVLPPEELAQAVREARRVGMKVVLAGSLGAEQVATALAYKPDFLAVRGAVCRESRRGDLDPALVHAWSTRLHFPSSMRSSCSA